MTRLIGAALCLAAALWPGSAAAQAPDAARNAHTRAHDGDTVLALDTVRLFVPAGSVAPGAIVGLGAGGVPGPDGRLTVTGLVVTAAGGLRAPAVVLVAVSPSDRAAAVPLPALVDSATGARTPCLDAGAWIACRVSRPGAYLVGGTNAPPPVDPLTARALASLTLPGAGSGRPVLLVVAVVIVAAVGGGAAALWLGGRG